MRPREIRTRRAVLETINAKKFLDHSFLNFFKAFGRESFVGGVIDRACEFIQELIRGSVDDDGVSAEHMIWRVKSQPALIVFNGGEELLALQTCFLCSSISSESTSCLR